MECHIGCPHCQSKDAEPLDLFSYQQSLRSDKLSAEDEQEDWPDDDPFDDSDIRDPHDKKITKTRLILHLHISICLTLYATVNLIQDDKLHAALSLYCQ